MHSWMKYSAFLGLLSICTSTTPPTLPHVHHALPHPAHLDLNTVKSVMETIEKMWQDYTALTNHSAAVESQLASLQERLASADRLCDIEKHALEQVHLVRVSNLERRLNASHDKHIGCDRNITSSFLQRLDSIWQQDQNLTLTERSLGTQQAMDWARNEISETSDCDQKEKTSSSDAVSSFQ